GGGEREGLLAAIGPWHGGGAYERAGSTPIETSAPGAAPDRDDLADRRLAVRDARVERAHAEMKAPGLDLLELLHERVEAPPLLVDLDNGGRGAALRAAARGPAGPGGGRGRGRSSRAARAGAGRGPSASCRIAE